MIARLVVWATTTLKVAVSSTLVAATAWSASLPPIPALFSVAIERRQEAGVGALIADLKAEDAHTRAMAACNLGRLRRTDVSAARDALVALLEDDAPVEYELCREGRNWGDVHWGDRRRVNTPGREAAIALERVGAIAVDPVVAVLERGSAAGREHAALALGLIEDSRAVPALIRALRDEVADVRARVAWALGMIESSDAVEALADALQDEDVNVRRRVVWALVQCVDADDPDFDYAALSAKLRKALIGGAARYERSRAGGA